MNDPTGGKRAIDQLVAKHAQGVKPEPDAIQAINEFNTRKTAGQQPQATSTKLNAEMKVKQTKVGDSVTLSVGEMAPLDFEIGANLFDIHKRAVELGLDGFDANRLELEARSRGSHRTWLPYATFVFVRVK